MNIEAELFESLRNMYAARKELEHFTSTLCNLDQNQGTETTEYVYVKGALSKVNMMLLLDQNKFNDTCPVISWTNLSPKSGLLAKPNRWRLLYQKCKLLLSRLFWAKNSKGG